MKKEEKIDEKLKFIYFHFFLAAAPTDLSPITVRLEPFLRTELDPDVMVDNEIIELVWLDSFRLCSFGVMQDFEEFRLLGFTSLTQATLADDGRKSKLTFFFTPKLVVVPSSSSSPLR